MVWSSHDANHHHPLMCLDVEHDGSTLLSSGERRARKEHACVECSREIERGETYQFWVCAGGEAGPGVSMMKMCAHCWGTIVLGSRLSGCPRAWYWKMVHSLDPDEGGFVGDILVDHDLSMTDRYRMLRTVVRRRKCWRRRSGDLYPVPS